MWGMSERESVLHYAYNSQPRTVLRPFLHSLMTAPTSADTSEPGTTFLGPAAAFFECRDFLDLRCGAGAGLGAAAAEGDGDAEGAGDAPAAAGNLIGEWSCLATP